MRILIILLLSAVCCYAAPTTSAVKVVTWNGTNLLGAGTQLPVHIAGATYTSNLNLFGEFHFSNGVPAILWMTGGEIRGLTVLGDYADGTYFDWGWSPPRYYGALDFFNTVPTFSGTAVSTNGHKHVAADITNGWSGIITNIHEGVTQTIYYASGVVTNVL